MSNEERALFKRISESTPVDHFTKREQILVDNLVKKSVLSKTKLKNGQEMVYPNENSNPTA